MLYHWLYEKSIIRYHGSKGELVESQLLDLVLNEGLFPSQAVVEKRDELLAEGFISRLLVGEISLTR